MKSCHCDNMDEPWGTQSKWNKSDRKKYIMNLRIGKIKNQRTTITNQAHRFIELTGGKFGNRPEARREVGEMVEGGQKTQTSSYEINHGI